MSVATQYASQALSEGFLESLWWGVRAIASYAGLGVALLITGFYALDVSTPGQLSVIIQRDRKPNAALLAAAGMGGVGLIVAASILGSHGDLVEGLIATIVFGLVGIAAQVISVFLFDKIVGIDVRKLLGEEKIVPAAVLLGAAHVTIGLVMAVAVL